MNQPIPSQNDDESSRTFWRAYLAWLKTATADELAQLERALANLQTVEVMPMVRAIRLVLRDEQATRALPASLVQRLEEVNWPGAQATG